MKKVFLLIFFIYFLPTVLVSGEIDSLRKVYQSDAPSEDKVIALLRLSTLQRNEDAYLSIKNAQNAIKIANKIPDKTYLIRSYAKLGATYKNLDSMPEAIESYLKGLEIAIEIENSEWQSNFLNYLGTSYLQYKQNKIALKYFKKSFDIASKENDSIAKCNVLNNIGIVFWRENKFDSSFKYIHASMLLSRDLKDSAGLVSSFNNLGMLQTELGDMKRALGYYNQAFMLAKSLDDKWEIANVLNNQSVLKLKLGHLEDIENNLKEAISISQLIKSSLLESDSYYNLSEYYRTTKDFEKSLDAFKKHSDIRMKLINEETSDKIAGLEKDFELRSKDKNLQKLSEANNIQYYLIILLATSLV
ncbi:MAG: tetratricopeptide repeat protein, partial [Candidatus Kapaibacterium sp.]